MLLVAAGASSALTLGRAQGVALIGRPLDMGIQMTLDSPADTGDLCTEAEVFYGDNRVDSRRVDLSTATNGAAANLRVRVSLPVDEAFVQVYLRVGCTAKFTRRYVLLSEQPADVAEAAAVPTPAAPVVAQVVPPAAAAATRPAAIAPAPAPDEAARPAPRAAAPAPAAPPVAPAPAPRADPPRPAPRPPAARAPAPAPAPAPATAAAERPRLRLDALEIRPQVAGTPAQRAASAAAAAASAAAAAEATATAVAELERNAQRIAELDAEMRKLREGMLRSDAALAELRARLEKAEGERYANGLVYTLAGLLAAAVAAAFAFWRRSRSQAQPSHWWDDSRHHDSQASVAAPDMALYEESQLPAAPAARASVAPTPVAAAPAAQAARGQSPADAAAPNSDRLNLPTGVPTGSTITGFGFLSSNPAARSAAATETDGLRVSDPLPLSSDELSDIQQEADFFVSLGEYDRAIEILRNHIEAHPQASAVAWLDLLEIHHKLGQKDEYEQLRRDFEWLFNAKAPSFAEFLESRDGLEAHPRLLARIQGAWPRREVLDILDEAIFRRPGSEGEEPLNVEGYRDLLFLHTIAAEISADDAVPVAPPPSAIVAQAAGAQDPVSAVDTTTLDIDLDELLRAAGIEPAPAAAGPNGAGHGAVPGAKASTGDGHLVDFELDPQSPFKLPGQRPPQG